MGVGYTQQIPFSKRIGGQLNYGANVGVITDTIVNANATITLLKAAVLLLATTPQLTKAAGDVNRALDNGLDLGLFSETHGVTTVADLVALTDASTTHRQNLFG